MGLPTDRRLIIVVLSGGGSGTYLVPAVERAIAGVPSMTMAVAGANVQAGSELVRHLGFVRDAQNLVAAADLVVSQAGKSTIDEAQSAGTPIIAIPLLHHFEQEANAKALGFAHSDLQRLRRLIEERVGNRTDAKNYDGARHAVKRILQLARE